MEQQKTKWTIFPSSSRTQRTAHTENPTIPTSIRNYMHPTDRLFCSLISQLRQASFFGKGKGCHDAWSPLHSHIMYIYYEMLRFPACPVSNLHFSHFHPVSIWPSFPSSSFHEASLLMKSVSRSSSRLHATELLIFT